MRTCTCWESFSRFIILRLLTMKLLLGISTMQFRIYSYVTVHQAISKSLCVTRSPEVHVHVHVQKCKRERVRRLTWMLKTSAFLNSKPDVTDSYQGEARIILITLSTAKTVQLNIRFIKSMQERRATHSQGRGALRCWAAVRKTFSCSF